VGHFCLLGSTVTDPTKCGFNPDPDPDSKHCAKSFRRIHLRHIHFLLSSVLFISFGTSYIAQVPRNGGESRHGKSFKGKTVALTEKSGGDRRHWTLYKSSLLITVNLKTFVNPGLAGKSI
jgi:hypothetical protein